MREQEDSGHISVDDDSIRYESTSYGSWRLALKDIRVIGEMTNQNGPFADDYFLCVATGPGNWLEASMYASGLDAFLQALTDHFGREMTLQLASSTDFQSRVIWPPELADHPMFAFTDNMRHGVLGRLADRVFGAATNTQTYTDEVRAYLESDQPMS